ncbi:hypothetical protein FKW77_008801 [Venturia effusa]|uniref:C2H2-type domain-containing protein n=1 Tax=Venturia effusa TaxID=50376 RepID=A0A517L1V0_9PEZI|nr:hypothetical protein FKW77_008801 [Venturia effusa]
MGSYFEICGPHTGKVKTLKASLSTAETMQEAVSLTTDTTVSTYAMLHEPDLLRLTFCQSRILTAAYEAAASLSSSTSFWSGNTATPSSVRDHASQASFDQVQLFPQHPAIAPRPYYEHPDPRTSTVPLITGPVLEPTDPSQLAVPHHLGAPLEQPIYDEAFSFHVLSGRPASVPPQEASWQGYTNTQYTNLYSRDAYITPYNPGVAANYTQAIDRLAPLPSGAFGRVSNIQPQQIGEFGSTVVLSPHPSQAHQSSLSRRRSAPDWAATSATDQLNTQTNHGVFQHDSRPQRTSHISGIELSSNPPTSHDSIPRESQVCPQCNKVLQDERGLKRHALTHSKDFALSHVCEECDMAFQFEKDLIRHTLTHNEDPDVRKYKCPSSSCNYFRKGFKRKDHFTRHVRVQHGMDPTPYLAQYD